MGDVRVNEDMVTQVVQTAVMRPGDTLILRVASNVTAGMVQPTADAVKAKMPDIDVLVVGGCEEMVIYRPEPLYNVELAAPSADDLGQAVAKEIKRRAGSDPRRTG